jgi:hypothetical protein
MLAIILGVMFGLLFVQNDLNRSKPVADGKTFLPIMIFSGIILISLTFFVVPQITTKILHPFWGQSVPYHTVGPRFWRFGAIIQVPRPL